MNTSAESIDTASIKPILAALAKRLPKARQAEAQAFANAAPSASGGAGPSN